MPHRKRKESVYHEFGQNDILQTVVSAQPFLSFASATAGWRGNVGASGSLSLYEGIRGRTNVKSGDYPSSGIAIFPLDPIDTHSIDKVIYVSGSYPSTGSVRFVKVRNTPSPNLLTSLGPEDWYEEHFRPIDRLFDWYSTIDPDYFTGSYDYYSLYLRQPVANQAPHVRYASNFLSSMTGAFSTMMWVKPTFVTASAQDFVLQSQRSRWKFFITGSSGKLGFTDFASIVTGSTALTPGVWQHVAVMVDGTSASFYVNALAAGGAAYTGTLLPVTGAFQTAENYLIVGAEYTAIDTVNNGFSGFLFESRIWSVIQSTAQLSGTYARPLTGSESGSTNLLHYSRFNDGPLATGSHGFAQGSGAFDYRSLFHGQLVNVRANLPLSPIWQPNDNVVFVTQKRKIDVGLSQLRVLHVPSMFYGRQIATGSVYMADRAYDNQGIVRVLIDDGRGSLYVSGSITRPIGAEDYTGNAWNKVGNVFYTEGLIVITEPSLWDFGARNEGDWGGSGDPLVCSFRGDQRINTKVFMCRLGQAQANASNNPTFTTCDDAGTPGDLSDDRYVIVGSQPVTYITAIGLYNEERQLVAVAKLAQAIRKREKDKLDIRLKMDF